MLILCGFFVRRRLHQLAALDRWLHGRRLAASDLDDACLVPVGRGPAARTPNDVCGYHKFFGSDRVFAPNRCGASSDHTRGPALADP
jgi:hypothetical protein